MVCNLSEHFHDWYLDGIRITGNRLDLFVRGYDEKTRKILSCSDVVRCSVENFLIQNIIYEVEVVEKSVNSTTYDNILLKMDRLYPSKKNEKETKIIVVKPSVGAEVVVECGDFSINNDA